MSDARTAGFSSHGLAQRAAACVHRLTSRMRGAAGRVDDRTGDRLTPRPPGQRPAPTAAQLRLITALDGALAGLRGQVDRRAVGRDQDLATALAPLAPIGRADSDKLSWEVPDGITVHVRQHALARVFLHLLAASARQAPGAPVTVSAAEKGGRVRLTVSNTAVGRPTSASAELGLRICARIVVGEGGAMHVQPAGEIEGGWRVVVDLPGAI
ncbi:hypothetical protein [Pilimelia columellifera]|uniref:hypothetical protein n=1 Tax=Pilimelia columellifera TaxID=706574 RepID=UPI0031D2A5D3